MFFSCRGLSFQKGITEASDEESVVKKQMLKTSKTKVLLCDSTKLDKVYFSLICHVSDVDYIVLDNNADESQIDNLRGSGAHIINEK
jgi:DeoR family fructose operon transcriptional repressor